MNMIQYGNPHLFHLLWVLLIVLLIIVYTKHSYRKKISTFIKPKMQGRLASSYSSRKSLVKKSSLLLCCFVAIIAMINPKIGTKLIDAKREGIDIVVALDLSRSMQAADITPSRLSRTKLVVKRFIEKLEGDRIALVGFTSKSFIQCPLTTDKSAALMLLDIMNPNLMPQDGTALSGAIEKAVSCFDQKQKKHNLIVLISDGEDHEAGIEESIALAKEHGAVIYTIGVGTLQGSLIPVAGGGFLKDNSGNSVVTQLNEAALRKIASSSNGNYYHANSGDDLDEILEDIAKLEKKEYGSQSYTDFEDRFQPFVLLAIIFLILDLVISERKKEVVVS